MNILLVCVCESERNIYNIWFFLCFSFSTAIFFCLGFLVFLLCCSYVWLLSEWVGEWDRQGALHVDKKTFPTFSFLPWGFPSVSEDALWRAPIMGELSGLGEQRPLAWIQGRVGWLSWAEVLVIQSRECQRPATLLWWRVEAIRLLWHWSAVWTVKQRKSKQD